MTTVLHLDLPMLTNSGGLLLALVIVLVAIGAAAHRDRGRP